MWRCTRCEKENQDAAEICVECGHARTMDYMYHRTLSRIPETVAANWKIVHDTSRENAQENRKAATEFIERKQGDLEYSRTCWQRKIADTQNEISRLSGVVEECDRKIEKIARADARRDKILYVIAFLGLLVTIRQAFPDVKNWLSFIDDILGITKIASVGDLFVTVLTVLWEMVVLYLTYTFWYVFCYLFLVVGINWVTDRNKTLKQITVERDNAQKYIDKQKAVLTDTQSQTNQCADRLLKTREDRENLINHLAQVSPQEMEAEFQKLIG